LWLYQLGIILYWVHDTSQGQARTYDLAARTVPMVEKARHGRHSMRPSAKLKNSRWQRSEPNARLRRNSERRLPSMRRGKPAHLLN